jgi:NHL repeat-containing protein
MSLDFIRKSNSEKGDKYVRRHSKAPSAGSTSGQGSRPGSFSRGAFAVRSASPEATGSGVASHANARAALLVLALSAFALLALAPSAFAAPKRITNEIGSPEIGQTGAHFNSPRGVAVNQSGAGGVPAGTLYVVDRVNLRVQRLSPNGAFVSTWGFGVGAGNAEFEICTKAQECRRGVESGEIEGAPGELREPNGIAVDQSNGNVYVSDQNSNDRRIDVFSAQGAFEGAFGFGIVDRGAELQFCTMQTGCKRADIATDFPGRGGSFPGAIGGVAVDAAGNIYVANTADRRMDVFEPILSGATVTGVEFLRSFGWGVNAGNTEFEVCTVAEECKVGLSGSGLGQFAEGSPTDVAGDSEGNSFVLDAGNKRVEEFSSAPAPITASFGSAALEGVFGSGATLFNVAIDPSATPNHLLVSGSRLGSGGKVAVAELDHSGSNALGAGKAHGEDLQVTSAGGLAVAKVSLGGNLYLSTATPAVLQGVFVLNEVPTIEPVTNITGTTATFKGKVVSNEIDVSYHFEYSTDGKTWTKLPASDVDAGTASETISVEAQAKGLTGSQPYRVRLVQNRPLGGGEATSAETTFTTLAEKPAILGSVASPVKDTSATFNAYLNPQNEATAYRFEYGPADCSANPCTPLPLSQANGGGLRLVTQTATGLEPATVYHFRLIATNASGETQGPDRSFQTFALGKQLPDNRAYELVTPPDTGAVVLAGTGFGETGRSCFDTFPATAAGDSVISISQGGSLPGLDDNGRLDLYESVRDPEHGWNTIAKSASAEQTIGGDAGLCSSPDHLYSTQLTQAAPIDEGSLVVEGKRTSYIRLPGAVADSACSPEPEGHFELVGCGSLGVDPEANARWITSGATHVVFISKKHLEPLAPPTNTEAVYDRPLGGPTQVVSLLPGNVTPGAGQAASYQGSSLDGSTIAFKLGTSAALYARSDGAITTGAADLVVGKSLTCTGGPTTGSPPPALTYQWLRNGAEIAAATASTYTVVAADEGKLLQCSVKASNGEGASFKNSGVTIAAPFPGITPPSLGTPTISLSGTAEVGKILTCNTGTWEGAPSFSFQWYRNGTAIAAATSSTYTVVLADVGAAVQCKVTGTNAGGAAAAFTALKRIEALPPTATANPAITGTPSVGNSLSCSNGTWTNGPTFTRQWLRNGTPIATATASTYTVVGEDEGKTLQCRVTATNSYASPQAVSARVVASPPPVTTPPALTTVGTVTGTAEVGKILTCSNGTWAGSPTFTRQWLRNGTPIGGATATTYTLVAADRQTSIQCQVTATNAGGSAVAIAAGATNGSRYVIPNPPAATATTPSTAKTFAGLSDDGDHLFYMQGGSVFDLNTATQSTTLLISSGNAQLVNISGDGSHVYFVSTSALTGTEQNSQGQEAEAGQNNLYVWDRESEAVHFVATVNLKDVQVISSHSLTRWTEAAVNPTPSTLTGRADDTSRATPDGSILVFESRADITGYDSGGHIEIYRYDAGDGNLDCVSCPPGGAPATGDAELQAENDPLHPTGPIVHIQNVTDDGQKVFFQTEDALAPGDVNGTWDVYEWKAGQQPYLISSGHGQLPSFLYGMTPTGSDVFFTTAERLVPQDLSTVISIYDARVGGGFPVPPSEPPCQGDNCQGTPSVGRQLPGAGSASFQGAGNETRPRPCRKNTRRVTSNGTTRCVKKHHKRRHHRANHNRRAAR